MVVIEWLNPLIICCSHLDSVTSCSLSKEFALFVYIDNMLVIGKSQGTAQDNPWLIVNVEKSMFMLLGLQIGLLDHKSKSIWRKATQLLQQGNINACRVAQFIGKLNPAAQAVFPVPLFYHQFQRDLQNALSRGNQDYKTLF